jgi:superfamily II RNA helicase
LLHNKYRITMITNCNSKFNDTTYTNDFNNYPFELSDFQKWAIKGIKTDKNVLITAHTGSGKTLPAEHAIQYFVNKGKKVIYCSPLKALSNEKFNDFNQKFKDISFGILTGDIKYNPDADVLIMTTEILKNNLFQINQNEEDDTTPTNKATLDFEMDIKNELACVIYDEIHYINDIDRGHVWEESIMLLPETTQIIGLSATIQNPEKLCMLLHQSNNKEVYLCSNKKRVVPLIHHLYYTIPENAKKKISEKTLNLIEDTINKPIVLKQDNTFYDNAVHHIAKIDKALFQYKNVKTNKYFVMNNMVQYLKEHDKLPGIVFVFSRKQCYEYARKITVPLFENNENKAELINKECKSILISKLSNWQEYTKLKEYIELVKLLEKGIAVHHSGVTPIFREMIELLFKKKYIRLLFATETFAVGINMPTRSVVFTSLKKYTQNGYRCLFPHEYTQMAGRAGRRGIDDVGYIYHLNNFFVSRNFIDVDQYRHMVTGNSQEIQSKINISPTMMLRYMYTTGDSNINEYLKNSMIYDEASKQQQYFKERKEALYDIYKQSKEKLENYEFITSLKAATNYYNYLDVSTSTHQQHVPQSVVKQYKKVFKKWGERNLEKDIQVIINFRKAEQEYNKINQSIVEDGDYFTKDIETHIKMLTTNKFITQTQTQTQTQTSDLSNLYNLTMKGTIASILQEVPSLPFAEYIVDNITDIANLSAPEITVLLSMFTNIRLSDEDKVVDPTILNIPYSCMINIANVKTYINKYLDIEMFVCSSVPKNYEYHYDICELIFKWCNAEKEEDTNKIFQELAYWGIFLGDFVKAVLKINNIVNELEKVAEVMENVKLLAKLQSIHTITLKSVISNNSLYL